MTIHQNKTLLKKILPLILLLLCCNTYLFAQTIQGTVTDMDGSTLPAVAVNNKTKGQVTLTDADGHYSIAANKGDNLEFSYLGYYTMTMIMPEDGSVFRRISLKKKLFSLDEVVIGPGWTPYQMDSIERRKTYKFALDRKKERSVFSPATAIADNFSAKAKQRWRFQKNFAKWEDQKFVDTRYTPEEVATLTGLRGDTLAAFINAYPMPADYARTATDLEIKMWIKYNYRIWIKHPVVPKTELMAPDSGKTK